MSQKKGGGGLRRPPQPASSDPESFVDEAGKKAGNAKQPQADQPVRNIPKKEPVHTFNLRMPVSEYEHLVAWAEIVSYKHSVHALVLKAVREKLDRLDRGEDES